MNNRSGVADENTVLHFKVRWLPAPVLIVHAVELVFKRIAPAALTEEAAMDAIISKQSKIEKIFFMLCSFP